jgi:putative aldouronate transport system substrate-binding protein
MRDLDKKAYEGMFRGVHPLRVSHFGNMQLAVEMEPHVKISEFMGPPTESMIQYNAYLQKIELETFANIIIGESPLNAFDRFVQDWQKNGGDAITEEVNAWYDEVKG